MRVMQGSGKEWIGSRRTVQAFGILGSMLLLTGCLSGAGTAVATAVVEEEAQDSEARSEFLGAYDQYLEEAQSSGCPVAQTQINGAVVNELYQQGEGAAESVKDSLREVSIDDSWPAEERAEAAYIIAAIELYRPQPNEETATHYLDLLEKEFPSIRPCATEWLRSKSKQIDELG